VVGHAVPDVVFCHQAARLVRQLHWCAGMTPSELSRAERLMIVLMCVPVILVSLIYLAA